MKNRLRQISAAQVTIEFISVVFAVLLALGLNSYKESKAIEREARALKKSILSECEKNSQKIDTILIKNQKYAALLDSLVRLPKEQQKGQFRFSYEFELLTKGAWEIAQNNPSISQLDPDFLLEVSDLYNMQDFFMDFSTNMIKEMGGSLTYLKQLDEPDLILSMHYKTTVINTFAEELKTSYQQLSQNHE